MTRSELQAALRRRVSRDACCRSLLEGGRTTGSEIWLVGGAVRDAALRRRSADLDFVVTRGMAGLIPALREAWQTRGFRFRKRGVTTWRFVVEERRIDLVDASRRGLDRDLARRELTVNAIAAALPTGRIHDPLGGLRDLRAGRLRPPAEGVFRQDPLRGLRLTRFLAQLPTFRATPAARRQAGECAVGLRRCAPERVREELDKLLGAPAPDRGLRELQRLGLLAPALPELAALPSCVAGRDRPDVWSHTVDAIACSATAMRTPGAAEVRRGGELRLLRWTLLLHDISKPETLARADDGRPTFHGHEVLGSRRADALLRRLRTPSRERRRVRRLVRWHLRPGHLADAGAPGRGLRRLVREAGDDLDLLLVHAACDARASGSPDARRRWRRLAHVLRELHRMDRSPALGPPRWVDGSEAMRLLDLQPGPAVGRVLTELLDAQQAGRVTTPQQAREFVRTEGPRILREV